MNISSLFTSFLARFPAGAAILYVGVVMVFAITAWTTVAEILARRDAVAATANVLSQLESRNPAAPARDGDHPAVADSVARFNGNILYTQVDLQGTQAKDGFVTVTVSCEVDQPVLQQVLYDLEAGMPFLFVDQLVVQGPAVPGLTPEGKLRVLISVSGQWQGSR